MTPLCYNALQFLTPIAIWWILARMILSLSPMCFLNTWHVCALVLGRILLGRHYKWTITGLPVKSWLNYFLLHFGCGSCTLGTKSIMMVFISVKRNLVLNFWNLQGSMLGSIDQHLRWGWEQMQFWVGRWSASYNGANIWRWMQEPCSQSSLVMAGGFWSGYGIFW